MQTDTRKQLHILLVEDEAITAIAEAEMLRRNGYSVTTAGTGEESVEISRADSDIDLVLMDINLGSGMDGIEAARIIIAERNIPVIFLSSHLEPEIVGRTEQISSYGYIVKDSGETVILATIKMAFRLAEARRREREYAEEVKRSRALFASVLEAIPIPVFFKDREGRYLGCNSAFAGFIGSTVEEIIGKTVHDFYDPDICRELLVQDGIVLEERCLKTFKTDAVRSDGSTRKVIVYMTVFPGFGNEPGGVVGAVVDLTERILAETDLRESEELFRAFMDHLPAYAFIKDNRGRYIFVNQGFRWIGGVVPEARIGKTDFELYPQDVAERLKANDDQVRSTGEPLELIEKVPYGTDNTIQTHLVKKFPIRRRGRRALIGGIAVDISKRIEAEDALQEALEEKTSLLRELQHRVKNNLLMISGLIGMEIERAENDSSSEVLLNLRNRVISLADLYSLLFKLGSVDRVNLDEYLEKVTDGIRQTYLDDSSEVKMVERYERVSADTKLAGTMGLILNELLTNALKYGFIRKSGGTIEILLSRGNGILLLSVANDGDRLPRGFNLKNTSGMGLRLINMLSEQIGGTFALVPGSETHFTVEIPWRG